MKMNQKRMVKIIIDYNQYLENVVWFYFIFFLLVVVENNHEENDDSSPSKKSKGKGGRKPAQKNKINNPQVENENGNVD